MGETNGIRLVRRAVHAAHLQTAILEGMGQAVVCVVQAVGPDAQRQPVRVFRALVQPCAGVLLLQPPQRLLHHLCTHQHNSERVPVRLLCFKHRQL